MNRLLFTISLFFICCGTVSAQDDKLNTIMEQFKQSYNSQDASSSYSLASSYFKEQISEDTWQDIFDQYYKAFGALNSYKILQAKEGAAMYLGDFEKGKQRIGLALNEQDLIVGFRFLPTEETARDGKMERNASVMSLPFKGEWFVMWGGDTKAQNYHVISIAQKNAFDLLILDAKDKSHKNKGYYNEDYYAFGQPLYAAADGIAVNVITGVEDNAPGTMNATEILGNSVTIKTEAGEYVVYAHFQKGSVAVKEGDLIKRGQFLGNCGNSGNSSEPHLHFHIQDAPNILNAVGVKCYFDALSVNGELKEDYSPVRFERISPQNE